MAKSMTIEEMRQLHHKALNDAEAKRTELRLVLASRYRELVGSSEEVLRMRERSEELHQLVHALPQLMDKLAQAVKAGVSAAKKASTEVQVIATSNAAVRRDLQRLPGEIQRALDQQQVHTAAMTLIQLFTLIATYSEKYTLANTLGNSTNMKATKDQSSRPEVTPLLQAQLQMTYLYVEGLVPRTLRMAQHCLTESAPTAQVSAQALATSDLLKIPRPPLGSDRATPLLDLYFDSKATLLQSLLNQLVVTNPLGSPSASPQMAIPTEKAEAILSQIVGILQHDIILHSYQIFCLRQYWTDADANLPLIPSDLIQTKASHFLAAHLPLIRTKVKSVLHSIAGTTASALGQIRQSLYDKTNYSISDQEEWQRAVAAVVNTRIVLQEGGVTAKFSLWSALFSNTFSSLVHNLLTTSFHSVHSQVVSTLRTSLANAPPFDAMLPHEAFHNTLHIATDLDKALQKVSDDAHELLVHAEERLESERRLRQSLYVQTCEIMGRLVCELRRMLLVPDATKEFLVGRLCHLLQYRLETLPTLLDARHMPTGAISFNELRSAFEVADDNDDGLITLTEAMEAVEAAFSGTQFHGAEMVRETLLLTSEDIATTPPATVTLNELALLCARGLQHDPSALEIIQQSLDDIIESCFAEWARAALTSASSVLDSSVSQLVQVVANTSEVEWCRIYGRSGDNAGSSVLPEFSEYVEQDLPLPNDATPKLGSLSPHFVGYLLSVASVLQRSVCPSDDTPSNSLVSIVRRALMHEALTSSCSILEQRIVADDLQKACASGLMQLLLDITFMQYCLFERNRFDWQNSNGMEGCKATLSETIRAVSSCLQKVWISAGLESSMNEKHRAVFEVSDLFLSPLLGDDKGSAAVAVDMDVSLSIFTSDNTNPHLYPLPSSRRFGLLPIQSDRSLAELQRRNKYAMDKGGDDQKPESSGGVIGLGFFSSMLKKK
jgi:hypothetical protein